jgi:hypothetical protein
LIARQVSWSPDGKFVYAAVVETDADIVLLDGMRRLGRRDCFPLNLTANAVRAQLTGMERDGVVRRSRRPRSCWAGPRS